MLPGTAASGILVAGRILILAFMLAIRYFELIAALEPVGVAKSCPKIRSLRGKLAGYFFTRRSCE